MISLISVQHTSASLTLNENYDSDVRDDTETFLNKIVPEVNFLHYICPRGKGMQDAEGFFLKKKLK